MTRSIKDILGKLVRGLLEEADGSLTGGRDGELQVMLDRDMTLAEAVHYHVKTVWAYQSVEGFDHEAGHVLLGLAFNAPPHEGLEGTPYQGSYDSEIYNFEIEKVLLGTITGRIKESYADRQGFIMGVLEHYRRTAPQENLSRTLGWLMAQETGKSYDALRQEAQYEYEEFQIQAEEMGIHVHRDPVTQAWSVTKPGLGEDFFYIGPDECILPDALEGGADFRRFERPRVQEIIEVYDRLLPALHLLQAKILALEPERALLQSSGIFGDEAERAMGEVKVRDIHQAILTRKATPDPEAEPDAVPA
ncbi:MAG: hypothetical protein KDI90_07950 [Alphaproteobacteria bacterium]|nr:hypothetical protein [Alphaproteobacteria bacterium]MCB9975488.1 hypothetical protein [Rhodospirillales bacterium]